MNWWTKLHCTFIDISPKYRTSESTQNNCIYVPSLFKRKSFNKWPHLGGLSDGFSRSIKLRLELFLSKLAGNQISQEHFTFYDYFRVYRLHCVGTKILITGSLFFPCIISLFSVKSNPQK